MTRLISAIEGSDTTQLYLSDHVMPLFQGVAETTRFSPRYNLRLSDTLRSRPVNAYWQWAVVVNDTLGYVLWRASHYYSGSTQFSIAVAGLPATMQQIGLDLIVQPRGQNPVRSLRAYVDSGSANEQSFGPFPADSSQLVSGAINTDFHLWIPGPLANGSHALVFTTSDVTGRTAALRSTILVAVPVRAYKLTVIAVPGAIDTRANGINNSGVIAGSIVNPDATTQAIRWSNGVVQLLPGPASSSGSAVNDAGIVAGYVGSGTQNSIGVWRDTILTRLDGGSGFRDVQRINSRGDVLFRVGGVAASQYTVLSGVFRDGVGTTLPAGEFFSDMNDAGALVGLSFIGGLENVYHAIGLPPVDFGLPTAPLIGYEYHYGVSSFARLINNAGQIIGDAANSPVPFFWGHGTSYWTLNPFGLGTVAAMNNANQVLGQLTDGSIAIWTIGGSVARVSFDAAGWTIDLLKGINNSGQIIAHGVNVLTGHKAALLLDPM